MGPAIIVDSILLVRIAVYALAAYGAYSLAGQVLKLIADYRESRSRKAIGDSIRIGAPTTLQGDALKKFLAGELTLDHQVYVRIPEPLDPIQRGKRYGDPIQAALTDAALGEVTGGGTMMGEFCGLDVALTDFNEGIALLKRTLQELNAPEGSMIEYECGEIPVYGGT